MPKAVTFLSTRCKKTTKRTGFGRDGEKHVELCLDAGQSSHSLALFSVDMYFQANVTAIRPTNKILEGQKLLSFVDFEVQVWLAEG